MGLWAVARACEIALWIVRESVVSFGYGDLRSGTTGVKGDCVSYPSGWKPVVLVPVFGPLAMASR